MLIGIVIEGSSTSRPSGLDERVERVRHAARHGFTSAWSGEPSNPDPLTTLAIAGRDLPGIGLGTSIVHTHSRHPLALAGQALTVQAATGNRLSLGISPGSRYFVELALGSSFEKPGRHIREYLSALVPLLRGEEVSYHGETVTAVGAVGLPGATPPSLLLSALGPMMLQIAGEMADGTITAFTGPVALAKHVVPAISRAGAAAVRPAPRVVAIARVSVTADPVATRARMAEESGFLEAMPSYRAMLDREGVRSIADVAIVGDETIVAREVQRYADAGATELVANPFGSEEERERTLAVLAGLARAGRTGESLAR